MDKKDLVVIKCPVCGTEYLPSEIYLPEAFFGKQKEITRTPGGELDFYMGEDMDLNETYICDHCGTVLEIHANLSFNVEPHVEEDFDTEYTSEINKPSKIKLSEEELF